MGANFRTVPIETLERASLPAEQVPQALEDIASRDGVRGVVALSTCNRVEVYVDALTDRHGAQALKEFFAARVGDEAGVEEGRLPQGFYLERGEDVVRHLFRVVCSLDSQVLGEAQVLGQAKASFRVSDEAGYSTEVLGRLFKDAFSVGKRAQSETAIGGDSVSLSTTAFKAAASEFDDIAGCQVLFIGSGEMASLTLAYLQQAGVTDFIVTNRTRAHAEELARACDARVFEFEDRYEALAKADIAFSMTSASQPVVTAAELNRARRLAGTSNRKLVIVDEAVPRDVQPICADLPGVVLYDMESLNKVIDDGVMHRLSAVGEVEGLVAQAEDEFLAWMQQQNVEPTIRAMYIKGTAVVEAEVERAARTLANLHGQQLDEDELKVLEAFGSAIMKKVLHGPTARLRRESLTPDSYYYTGAARYLFGLDAFPAGCSPHDCVDKPCLKGKPCVRRTGASGGSSEGEGR